VSRASGTVGEALAAAADRLAAAGIDTARLDAEVLLAAALGGSRATVLSRQPTPLASEEAWRFAELVVRRLRREPVAYLLGEKEFWSLPLAVDRRVLIPRPETEGVVEAALAEAARVARSRAGRPLVVADVGTGSGAIAVAMAHELGRRPPGSPVRVVALDRARAALDVAAANARRHASGAAPVLLLCGDLTGALAPASVDVLVSNPPYLSQDDLEQISPEVRAEPVAALRGGGNDGAGVLRELVRDAVRVLRPDGALVSEIGCSQGAAAAGIARDLGFEEVRLLPDLAGRDRVLLARRGRTAGT
jgi:release factor glutamine methyltransferase